MFPAPLGRCFCNCRGYVSYINRVSIRLSSPDFVPVVSATRLPFITR